MTCEAFGAHRGHCQYRLHGATKKRTRLALSPLTWAIILVVAMILINFQDSNCWNYRWFSWCASYVQPQLCTSSSLADKRQQGSSRLAIKVWNWHWSQASPRNTFYWNLASLAYSYFAKRQSCPGGRPRLSHILLPIFHLVLGFGLVIGTLVDCTSNSQ